MNERQLIFKDKLLQDLSLGVLCVLLVVMLSRANELALWISGCLLGVLLVWMSVRALLLILRKVHPTDHSLVEKYGRDFALPLFSLYYALTMYGWGEVRSAVVWGVVCGVSLLAALTLCGIRRARR